MREVVAVGKKVLGTDHPEVASWVNNLAQLLNIMVRSWICVNLDVSSFTFTCYTTGEVRRV